MDNTISSQDGVVTDPVTAAINERQQLLAGYLAHADTLTEDDRLAVTVKVFQAVLEQARRGGTFRYLIYDRLGFSPDAYLPLHFAGGSHISDGFVLTDDYDPKPPILATFEEMAKAAPMQPHPTLKRADGTPIPWPTQERSQMFSALRFMETLVESNRLLVEANKRLSAQQEVLEQELERRKASQDVSAN